MSDVNERAALRAIALRGPDAVLEALKDMLTMSAQNASNVEAAWAAVRINWHGIDSGLSQIAKKRVVELQTECFETDHVWEWVEEKSIQGEGMIKIKKCQRCCERKTRPQ